MNRASAGCYLYKKKYMKPIIVPVNFSPCAANAARYSADLARAIHSDLHLIHVLQVPVNAAELTITQYLYKDMVEAADIALKQLQFELIKRTNNRIKVEISLEAGNFPSKVKDLCGELKPYAVVFGAAGPTYEKFLAGSAVSSLLHNLDYPVLVVPETYTFHPFRRVLLACDLEDIGSGIPHFLPLLKGLREQFGSRFDIVTVGRQKVLTEDLHILDSVGWKTKLKELYPEIHYVQESKVEDGILDYLAHNEADLIMVFPKKHGFLEFHVSQSRKVAERSPVPVLSVRA
jgi:nucleotide-binding universal stress UspA family protein